MQVSSIGDYKELKRDLLRECSKWMYNKVYSECPSEDKDGHIIRDQQPDFAKKNKAWIFSGYFNTISKPPTPDGTPKIKRRDLKIPRGDKIFCMVASSHGTEWEQKIVPSQSLSAIANRQHGTWQEVRLTVDGVILELDVVETEKFGVVIPDPDPNSGPNKGKPHPFVKEYQQLGVTPGPTDIVSVGLVNLIEFPDVGGHVIDFYAKSPGDPPTGDIPYEISVRYYVESI